MTSPAIHQLIAPAPAAATRHRARRGGGAAGWVRAVAVASSPSSGRLAVAVVVRVARVAAVVRPAADAAAAPRHRGPRRGRAPLVGEDPRGSRRTGRASVRVSLAARPDLPSAAATRRSGSRQALDGSPEAGQHGLGELVRAHGRGARRLEAEGRPDREGRAPRSGRRRRAGRARPREAGVGRRPRGSARTAPRRAPGRVGPAADRAAARPRERRRGSSRRRRRRRPTSASATSRRGRRRVAPCPRGRCGRGRAPRARAGTTGRAVGGGRARPQG